MAKADLTAQRLRELLDYDEKTGVFVWRVDKSRTAKAGNIAGHACPNKYIRLSVAGRQYWAHRLAWMYITGAWPVRHIDHIDGNPANNAFSNLRDCGQSENMQNQRRARSDSKSGFLGASPDRRKRNWVASIKAGGKKVHLGTFNTPAQAHAAYVEAKRKLHPGCTL